MSCSDKCCGTGLDGINNPKPGDPDNNVSLSANMVYGGISVSWSFPTTNPQAVAHTILYRGLSNDFTKALELARVGGSIYFDALNPTVDTTYHYWIRFLTVNGTLLEKVGPVSAIAKPRGQQTLESLTGLIDSGVLAQELKTSIAGVSLQGQALLKEIQDRIAANSELSGLIALVQSGQQEAMTYVQQEITQRTTADSAIVQSINTMAAAVAQNTAAILQESQVRADKDGAMASQISTLFTQTGNNASAIQNESIVRSNVDSALASSISTLTSRVGTAEGTLLDEQTVRASADAVLASRITSAESTLFGNTATGQVALTTKITALDGKVTSIGSLYTAKVQVNDLIGGFGVYNDGRTVEAGFDVDRFWVGRTGPDKVKPFIIDSGIVYIDKARIRNADIDTLKISGNAVTVPYSATFYGQWDGHGFGSWMVVAQGSIYLDQPGMVFAMATANIQYGTGWGPASTKLEINGVTVGSGGGEEAYVTAAHSGGVYCGVGTVTVTLSFSGSNKAHLYNPSIFIMGAKR